MMDIVIDGYRDRRKGASFFIFRAFWIFDSAFGQTNHNNHPYDISLHDSISIFILTFNNQ